MRVAERKGRRKDPLIGKTINGRFTILELIARGGMGKVYKAEQAPLGRICALKVLNPKYDGDDEPEFQRRFFLEASTASKLSHPNTVTIFDYGRDEDIYYIAMEYVRGRTLFQLIRDDGPLSEGRVAHIVRQVGRSLREAHALGVIHRDMKPANVLLLERSDEADAVKVLDFGLVKQVAEGEGEDLTQQGLFMGSPKYMAPEQILGHRVCPATDIYALGVVAYELLTSRVPFDAGSSVKTLMAHVNDPPPSMRQVLPSILLSAPMEAIVMRCLAKEPEDRYPDVDHLLRDLTQVEGGGTLTDSLQAPAVRLPVSEARQLRSSPPEPEPSGMTTRSVEYASYPPSGSAPVPRAADRPSLSESLATAPSVTQPSLEIAPELSRRRLPAVGMWLGGAAVAAVLVAFLASRDPGSAVADGAPTTTTSEPAAPTVTEAAAPVAPAPLVRTLHVTSSPSGAKVEEGGKVVCGATPCDLTWRDDAAVSEHELVFSKPGYQPSRLVVTPEMSSASGTLTLLASRPQTPPRATTAPTSAPAEKGKPLSGYKDSPY